MWALGRRQKEPLGPSPGLLPLPPVDWLGCPLLRELGVQTWEPGVWTEVAHKPWLPEAPPVPPGHGRTSAVGGGDDVEWRQRVLGGNTIKDQEKDERMKEKEENNKEILIK